jgi:electron transport complex protein RnfB
VAEVFTSVIVVTAIAGLIGLCLQFAAKHVHQTAGSPIDRVNALLPQTQCTQCGYPGCRPYAEAIVKGAAGIDQCAPGGDATITALANLLGQHTRKINPEFGAPKPPSVAIVDEEVCIGCALCLDACPVDAIVGAARYTHTVIRRECTGCELCVPPCPVDCIAIVPLRVNDKRMTATRETLAA